MPWIIIMIKEIRYIFIFILVLSIVFTVETKSDMHLNSIDVENKLGSQLSADISFVNDYSQEVTLGRYFNQNMPIIIVMAYYQCPMLCSLVLNGLSKALDESHLTPGEDFSLLTLSIDPTEGPELSKKKKSNYLDSYFSSVDSDFWTFGTTTQDQIDQITNELGFIYSYDESIGQYAHPAIVYVLTESGIISNQIFGIDPTANDFKLAVLNAHEGSISSIFDKILLYCYKYDPKAGNYTLLASNVMKVAGASTVFIMGLFLSLFWIKEKIV